MIFTEKKRREEIKKNESFNPSTEISGNPNQRIL